MPTELLSSDHPTVVSRAPRRGTEVVLLVDDEPAPRRLGRHVLQSFGYTTLEAECTDEAVRVAAAHPGRIDLLITDIIMPGECGRTLAAMLTARRPGMRVLFVSAFGEDAGTRHGVRRPVHFLAKPFSVSDLALKVRQVLDAG